jgi:MFS transporter, FSR family, fosmidomycin resistance protein
MRTATPITTTGGKASRVLAVCCGAHFLHDGYTDLVYLLLPIWQSEFGLSLAAAGLLKTVFSGALAALQMPAGLAGARFGEKRVLVLGTLVGAAAYFLIGWSSGFAALALCLALGGAGASVQHPLSSALTSHAYDGRHLRTALGTYNFAGDVGKVALPTMAAAMIAAWHWRWTTTALALLGLLVALAIVLLLPAEPGAAASGAVAKARGNLPAEAARRGFRALCLIGVIDAATRTGFLTFLPFLLVARGASVSAIGVALSLVFAGAAAGKFVCGAVAQRCGVLRTVIVTECATAAGILLLLGLDPARAVLVLPAIGVALNGTSSVLYGTVAELAAPDRRARAFSLFYSVTLGAGALAPVIYGRVSDAVGVPAVLVAVALIVLLVVPLTMPLRRPLALLANDNATR